MGTLEDSAVSYWLGASPAGPARPTLAGAAAADVAIVGAGFTGLWTALALTDTDPSLRVVVLEAESVGFGASGRNGGFCQASLTHGLSNGLRHFPDEIDLLEREGIANLRDLIAFTREHGIDCDLEETGSLAVADQPHQVEEFRASVGESAPGSRVCGPRSRSPTRTPRSGSSCSSRRRSGSGPAAGTAGSARRR